MFSLSLYAPPLRGVASVKHEELYFLKSDSSYPDYIFHEITLLYLVFFRKKPSLSDQNNLSNFSKKLFTFSPFRHIARYLSHFIFSFLFVFAYFIFVFIFSFNTSDSFIFIFSSSPFSFFYPLFCL